jgi:hypothetical protein
MMADATIPEEILLLISGDSHVRLQPAARLACYAEGLEARNWLDTAFVLADRSGVVDI